MTSSTILKHILVCDTAHVGTANVPPPWFPLIVHIIFGH